MFNQLGQIKAVNFPEFVVVYKPNNKALLYVAGFQEPIGILAYW